jgi:hypothetical protein
MSPTKLTPSTTQKRHFRQRKELTSDFWEPYLLVGRRAGRQKIRLTRPHTPRSRRDRPLELVAQRRLFLLHPAPHRSSLPTCRRPTRRPGLCSPDRHPASLVTRSPLPPLAQSAPPPHDCPGCLCRLLSADPAASRAAPAHLHGMWYLPHTMAVRSGFKNWRRSLFYSCYLS